MMLTLPDGWTGRLLALGIAVFVLVASWFAIAVPLLDAYGDRAEALAERRILIDRFASLAGTLPALRHQASTRNTVPGTNGLLAGASDAIAAASLLERFQTLANQSGITVASTETLPAAAMGHYRRIGLRVSLEAPYPAVVNLLRALEGGAPRMLVDELVLRASVAPGSAPILSVGITLHAFRTATNGKENEDAMPSSVRQ
jgi:general secretion pathway protein M